LFYLLIDVYENGMLRKIFGPKTDEMMREWTKLHNEKIGDLYSSLSIIRIINSRRMTWAAHVALMGEKRKAYRLLVRKSQRKRPLGRPRHKWVGNIKMDLVAIGWGCLDWIGTNRELL
jgi:hypothetical protein